MLCLGKTSISSVHTFPKPNSEWLYTKVVPLDNFMIYKDIIRLDRPDWEQKEPVR